MSQMVDRVARALCEDDYQGTWLYIDNIAQEGYRKQARAALAAMREPTEAMINSTWASSGDIRAWRAFIDEALK